MHTLELFEGVTGRRMCEGCGSYGRWALDGRRLCNGCLMGALQDLYRAAGGYVSELDGLTRRTSMWQVPR